MRIVTCEPLRSGKPSELLLKFINPTQYQTQITLLNLDVSTEPMIKSESGEMKEVNRENLQLVSTFL